MIHLTKEAAQQVLDAMNVGHMGVKKRTNYLAAIATLQVAIDEPEQEPIAWPKPKFTEAAPVIDVGYDIFGGVDIRLGGEFIYVHINYDYNYTNNAARKSLADNIVKLLTNGHQAQSVEQATADLIDALRESKGWTTAYANAIVRDAIDRVPDHITDASKLVGCVQHDCAECQARLSAPQVQELTQPDLQRMWNAAMSANRQSTTDAAMDFGRAVLAAREGK